MKKILALILFWSLCAFGAEQITMFITVTNPAVTGNEITVNGTTRIWTNSYSAATIQTNSLAGPAATATNLAFSLSAYILSDNPWVYQTSTNIVRLVFPLGVVASGSQVGNWCAFTYSTQIVTRAWPVRVPMSIESAANQTNFASMIVTGLGKATNRLEPGWEVMTNFAAIARANDFTGTNRFVNGWWTNATLINLATAGGILGNLTNGVLTNTILVWPVMTNASSYGGFRSPGTGSLSEQYGSGASATNDGALALGQNAKAGGLYAISIGQGSTAYGNFDVSIGSGAEGGYGSGVAIGTGAGLNASNAIAIGNSAIANYENSVAIGKSVATTETNQMMLGAATHKVRIPGRIEPTGTITNAVFTGTNSIGVPGGPYSFLALRRLNVTSLANGNNAGINPGGATYIKVSGPTAAFAINGITNGTDGYLLIIENNSGYTMTIANDSGVDPAPANRIYTMTGGDVSFDGSSVVTMVYDAAISRWICIGGNPAETENSYAELYTDANAGAQTLALAATYYKLTNFNTVGNQNLLIADATTNTVVISGAGLYSIQFHISFSGTASKTFTTAIFTNGVECVNVKCERKLGTGGDIGSAGAHGLVSLPDAATVDVRCKPDDAAVSITVKQCNLTVHKIE